jgi:exoribonuclease R
VSITNSIDYYVFQQKYRNRALDGDMVVIALLSGKQRENEVGRKGDKQKERREENDARQKKCAVGEDNEDVAVGNDDGIAEDLEDVPFSKVVAIEGNGNQTREFTGTLEPPGDNGGRFMMFKPRDKRVPLIMVPVGEFLCG